MSNSVRNWLASWWPFKWWPFGGHSKIWVNVGVDGEFTPIEGPSPYVLHVLPDDIVVLSHSARVSEAMAAHVSTQIAEVRRSRMAGETAAAVALMLEDGLRIEGLLRPISELPDPEADKVIDWPPYDKSDDDAADVDATVKL